MSKDIESIVIFGTLNLLMGSCLQQSLIESLKVLLGGLKLHPKRDFKAPCPLNFIIIAPRRQPGQTQNSYISFTLYKQILGYKAYVT